ncbi:FMN-binding protein [Streptomyces sp. NPDC014864]|uniref:FMN-binding protein n=1 Tax=Streptomyces sp. NPDC014864 TaxID=3364924 RepID=UPI0037001DF0
MRKRHPLRQLVLVSAATVSTVVLLLALKPHTDPALAQGATAATSPGAVISSPPSSPSPSLSSSASASPTKTAKKRASSSPTARASHSSSAAPARTSSAPSAPKTTSAAPAAPTTRTVTGGTVQTKYGPVQVRITLTGGKITDAAAVQSPSSAPRSQEISSTAIPQLNRETLAAQSANIDSVSGATYTSQGYKQSLQSALDQAG